MSVFALPSVFRASALDAAGDPWITNTLHLRVRVWGELGFPLHPFVAWRLQDFSIASVDVRWTDGQSPEPLGSGFDLAAAGGQAVGTLLGSGGAITSPEWLWLRLDAGGNLTVEALDRVVAPYGERVLASRTAPPFALAGLGISRLRARGVGTIGTVQGVNADGLAGPINAVGVGNVETVFGLPMQGSPWYADVPAPLAQAKTRLIAGQSLRLGPPDQPAGPPFDPLPNGADADLVLTHWAPDHIEAWLKAGFSDSATVPITAVRTAPSGVTTPVSTAVAGTSDALLTVATDPRLARYLGLATAFTPQAGLSNQVAIWLIAAQWAVRPARIVLGNRPLSAWLQQSQAPPSVAAALDSLFPQLPSIRARLSSLNQPLPPAAQWSTVTLITAAAVAVGAAPNPPVAPSLATETSFWNPAVQPETWTQRLTLGGAPPPGQAGFARLRPAGIVSLHRREPDGTPSARAVAILPHWSETRVGALEDGSVPPDPAGGAWRVWLADEFGRWGDPADVTAPRQPARPLPPPPVPELLVTPADSSPVAGPRSPGTLTVRVTPPDPSSLAPGARPVQRLDVSVDNAAQPSVTVGPADQLLQLDVPIGAFAVGEQRSVTVSAVFVDADGQASPPGIATRQVTDPRPFLVSPTGPQLIWTGRPDATGRAELGVQWTASDRRARYRVYLGDERVLCDALGLVVDPAQPRAERAIAVWQRKTDLTGKQQFSLLNQEPIGPDADSVVRFRHQLPAGLRGVQFLRVVPVSAGLVEGDFASCGLVPVAVPTLDQPPPPTLHVTFQSGTGARVQLEARGLRPDVMSSRGFPGSGASPEFRIRRARGRMPPELYMPVTTQGILAESAVDPQLWTAEIDEAEQAIPPFIRHLWVAEVRYPAEPALATGVNPVTDPLAVTGLGPQPGSVEAEWSSPSLPGSTVNIPDQLPPAIEGIQVLRDPGGLGISGVLLSVPAPMSDPRALGPWRVAIYRQVTGGAPKLVGPPMQVDITPFTFLDTDSTPPDQFSVSLIDPLGRQGPAVTVPVSAT